MRKPRHKRRGGPDRVAEDMADEYDFSKATRGVTARRYRTGTNVIVLDPDVAAVFRNAATVNSVLRLVARLAAAAASPRRRRAKSRPRKR